MKLFGIGVCRAEEGFFSAEGEAAQDSSDAGQVEGKAAEVSPAAGDKVLVEFVCCGKADQQNGTQKQLQQRAAVQAGDGFPEKKGKQSEY